MFLCLFHHLQGDHCVVYTFFSVVGGGDVSKKEGTFDYVDDETSLFERHISYSFHSLSYLNCTCPFLYQTARLSIRTADFCYCCTFRVSSKLWRVIQIWFCVLLKRKLVWIQSYRGLGKYLQEWQQCVWIIHEGPCFENVPIFLNKVAVNRISCFGLIMVRHCL